jgi:hypothetical protein
LRILAKLWPTAVLDVIDAEVEGNCPRVGSTLSRKILQKIQANVYLGLLMTGIFLGWGYPEN